MGAENGPDWIATYRASVYAFRDRDAWWRFTLQASHGGLPGWKGSVGLVTAWNPDSREMPAAWNRAANERLAAELRARGVRFAPAYGASLPGVEPAWREDGFALFDVGREELRAWGVACGQRAVVWLDASEAWLLLADAAGDTRCGAGSPERILAQTAAGER